MELTETTLKLFLAYAKDAGNWSGTPLMGAGGNVSRDERAERGNVTQMKQAGLVKTFRYEGCNWIEFTPAGVEFAAKHGVTVRY